MSTKQNLVRCGPPVGKTLVCRDCDTSFESMDGETFEDQACTYCGLGVEDESRRPAGVYIDTTRIPIDTRCDRPAGCVSCGDVWVVSTTCVLWFFEGGLSGAVCPKCARQDPETATWQKFCDIADSVDALMQTVEDSRQRKLIADLISDRSHWFSMWRDVPLQDD